MIKSKKDLDVYKAVSGMYYYTFRVPARYHPEGKVGKQVRRSSGKRDESTGREVAWQDFVKECGLVAAADAAPRKSFKNSFPTVAEVCEHYRKAIHAHSKIKEASARTNVNCLLWHCKRAGLDPAKTRVDQLTATTVLEARKAHYREREVDWDEPDPDLNYALNSMWNQARSVLGENAAPCYRDWKPMPPRIGFLEAPRLDQKDPSFRGIGNIAEIDGVAQCELKSKNTVAWVCYELARWGGLRAGEIAAFEASWLVIKADSCYIEIRPRGGKETSDGVPWSPKGNKARNVPIKADRVTAWKAALGGTFRKGYLVPGGSSGKREAWLSDVVNGWIAPWLSDREKRLHELRKQIGSEVYTNQGAAAAAEFLGDTLETTMRHYAKFLGSVKPM